MANTSDAILLTDQNGKITWVNRAFESQTGYDQSNIIGITPNFLRANSLLNDLGGADYYRLMGSILKSQGHWTGETKNKRKDNTEYPAHLTIQKVTVGTEGNYFYYAIIRDLTYEFKLRQEGELDHLTGLLSRRRFEAELHIALSQAERGNYKIAVLFLDLDRFKWVNDTYTHHIGDQLLKEVAKRLRLIARIEDGIARLGGDEFAGYFTLKNPEDAIIIAKKVLAAFTKNAKFDQLLIPIYSSIGISIYPNNGTTAKTLIDHADVALYHAKENGRGIYSCYGPEMGEKRSENLLIQQALQTDLTERVRLELFFQPIIDLSTGEIVSAEALLRWFHPEYGIGKMSPLEWIMIAEECGLIIPLGNWVLEKACEMQIACRNTGFDNITIAVNLSPKQFLEPNLTQNFTNIVKRTNANITHLKLEVTETSLTKDMDLAVNVLHSLREKQFKLAIDDFGINQSCLAYLKKFPVHELKVDKLFVDDIGVDKDGTALLNAIISMGQNLNKTIVAEGIETKEQYTHLSQFISSQETGDSNRPKEVHGQGYLFSPAINTTSFIALLQKNNGYIFPKT